jgi:hypothetical protein
VPCPDVAGRDIFNQKVQINLVLSGFPSSRETIAQIGWFLKEERISDVFY